MAKVGGFDKPILHGLCTYGIACKLLLEKLGHNDPVNFHSLSGRFTSHVFPGETLIVEVWKKSNTSYIYTTKTKERGLVVTIGVFEIHDPMNAKL